MKRHRWCEKSGTESVGENPRATTSRRVFLSLIGSSALVFYFGSETAKAQSEPTLDTVATVPSGTQIFVTVFEDVNGDGEADFEEEIEIGDGENSYTISNLEFEEDSEYWVDVESSVDDDASEEPTFDEGSIVYPEPEDAEIEVESVSVSKGDGGDMEVTVEVTESSGNVTDELIVGVEIADSDGVVRSDESMLDEIEDESVSRDFSFSDLDSGEYEAIGIADASNSEEDTAVETFGIESENEGDDDSDDNESSSGNDDGENQSSDDDRSNDDNEESSDYSNPSSPSSDPSDYEATKSFYENSLQNVFRFLELTGRYLGFVLMILGSVLWFSGGSNSSRKQTGQWLLTGGTLLVVLVFAFSVLVALLSYIGSF